MAEPDASQIFAKALPLIAVVFMASGIVGAGGISTVEFLFLSGR